MQYTKRFTAYFTFVLFRNLMVLHDMHSRESNTQEKSATNIIWLLFYRKETVLAAIC